MSIAKVVVQNVEPLTGEPGFAVDILDYEALGLYDTSSRWFSTEVAARDFAWEVAALLIIEVEVETVVVS